MSQQNVELLTGFPPAPDFDVSEWVHGMLVHSTIYTEAKIDRTHAAAERLAEVSG